MMQVIFNAIRAFSFLQVHCKHIWQWTNLRDFWRFTKR